MDHDVDNLRRIFVEQNKMLAANMLADTERKLGIFTTKSTAEGMIRAAADWVFANVGPLTAYQMIAAVEDELALRIAERAGKTWQPKPEPRR